MASDIEYTEYTAEYHTEYQQDCVIVTLCDVSIQSADQEETSSAAAAVTRMGAVCEQQRRQQRQSL